MRHAFNRTAIAVATLCILQAGEAKAHPAWGIVADPQGQVYFSDLSTVWRIDAQGELSVFRTGGHTHDLGIDDAGNVYGEDDFSAIWKMTPAGEFSYIQAPTEGPPRGIGVLRDRAGNIYAVEQNNHLKLETLLLRRTPEGKVSTFAGSRYGHADGEGREAEFSNIVGMALGPDSALFLTDGASIRRVGMDGTVTTLARNIPVEDEAGKVTGVTSLFGIAVDRQGNVIVADYGNRRILRITSTGRMTTLSRAEGSWFPVGVAERDGQIYVLEEAHTPAYEPIGTRVRKLRPDGSDGVLAVVGAGGIRGGGASVGSISETSREKAAEPGRTACYRLFGVGAGVWALALLLWRWRRATIVGHR